MYSRLVSPAPDAALSYYVSNVTVRNLFSHGSHPSFSCTSLLVSSLSDSLSVLLLQRDFSQQRLGLGRVSRCFRRHQNI